MIDWDEFFRNNVKPGRNNAGLPAKITKLLLSEPKEDQKESAARMAAAMTEAGKRRKIAESN